MKKIFVFVAMLLSACASAQMKAKVTSNTSTSHQVVLSWTTPVQPSGIVISGYNIFKGTVSGQESPTPVNTSLITGLTFTDTTVTTGTTYFYTSQTVCNTCSPTASGPSNEVQASIPGGQPLPPVMNTPTAQ